MIICPNCNHENPDEAAQCELCYSPLPATSNCPECGASVQADATFCGQCGHNLKASTPSGAIPPTIVNGDSADESAQVESAIPPTVDSFTLESEIPATQSKKNQIPETELASSSTPPPESEEQVLTPNRVAESDLPQQVQAARESSLEENPWVYETPSADQGSVGGWPHQHLERDQIESSPEVDAASTTPDSMVEIKPEKESSSIPPKIAPPPSSNATQLQLVKASLLHVQTNTQIEIPQQLAVVHIGKPNSQIPPDVDVSGFPNSEIVSRVHADIRVEGDAFFLEDMGSSNGTYVNHTPLLTGDRHRLRTGDRIALGKGDKVTFIFQAEQ